MHNILLIENDKDLCDYIKENLINNGFSVQVIHKGAKYTKAISKKRPDLIIIDWCLDNVESSSIVRRIQQNLPNIPVIVISTEDDIGDLEKAFKSGARDYMVKPIDIRELIIRVKARLRILKKKSQTKKFKVRDLIIDDNKKSVSRKGKRIRLSKTEYSLLLLLTKNKDMVLSRDEILSMVWNTEEYIEPRVVDVYIGYLRKKIDTGHKDKLLRTVRGFGYMLRA